VGVLRTFLAGSVGCILALAGTPSPTGRKPFALVGTEQGLFSQEVVSITQDTEGFLWFGSEDGLMRYEGGQCRRWSEAEGLPSSSVPRVLACPRGGVWAGTLRGLALFKDGRFHPARFGDAPSTTIIGSMALDRSGRLWAYSEDGLLVRQREGTSFDVLPWKPQGSVYGLSASPRTGTVYVAGEFGIQAFREDGTTRAWSRTEGLPSSGSGFAMEDGQGRLWAGSGPNLWLLDTSSGRFKDHSGRLRANLSPNSEPYLDPAGRLWLPTQNGVQELDGEHLDTSHGLPFKWVRTVFLDREGSLWVIGSGLAHSQGKGRIENHPFSHGDIGEVVWSIARDAQGRMVAGTDDGVELMENAGPRKVPGTSGMRIKGQALDAEGVLWMVSTRGPTLWWPPRQTKATLAALGPLGANCNTVFADSHGTVWLGSVLHGLLRWVPARRSLVQEVGPDFLKARTLGVFELREDPGGRLWAGTDHGILVRELDGTWQYHADPKGARVRGIAPLADGTAWIHYEEPLGLNHVRLEPGRIRILETRGRDRGLSSDMVYAVRVDGQGRIWASTNRGLCRLDPFLEVGRADGMLSEDCSANALRVEGDTVWVGTSSGLMRYSAIGTEAPPDPPRAGIMLMAFGDRKCEPPFSTPEIVPYQKASLDFRVAAPSYGDPARVRFQVRLLGLEEYWRDLVGRQGHFPALHGGNYRFEVRAALPNGAFGPAASMSFRVKPPWWATWWAETTYILGACLAILGLHWLRTTSLARAKASLEILVAVRTEELTQRNAELSTALSNVNQLRGLLPICMRCKKIKNDGGYWNKLEAYLSAHTGARFSHGYCPECAEIAMEEMRKEIGLSGGAETGPS